MKIRKDAWDEWCQWINNELPLVRPEDIGHVDNLVFNMKQEFRETIKQICDLIERDYFSDRILAIKIKKIVSRNFDMKNKTRDLRWEIVYKLIECISYFWQEFKYMNKSLYIFTENVNCYNFLIYKFFDDNESPHKDIIHYYNEFVEF